MQRVNPTVNMGDIGPRLAAARKVVFVEVMDVLAAVP
jgi:hypothetical protein